MGYIRRYPSKYTDKTHFPKRNVFDLMFLQTRGRFEYGKPVLNAPTGRFEDFKTKDELTAFLKANGISAIPFEVTEFDWKATGNERVFLNRYVTFIDENQLPIAPPSEFDADGILNPSVEVHTESVIKEEKML